MGSVYAYGNTTTEIGVFTEGIYYIAINCAEEAFLTAQLSLKKYPMITQLKKQAVLVTDAMLQTGSITLPKLDEEYVYLISNGMEVGSGNLMKVTVPAYTTYTFTSQDNCLYVYEENMTTYVDGGYDVTAENTTDTEKHFIFGRRCIAIMRQRRFR